MCAARAYTGLVGSRLFSHDAFMYFDGAWRMMNGQRPHIDFYSHLGVLSYLSTLIGLWISGGTAWGFGYGQALTGLLLGTWTYLLGKKRLSDWPLALLCVSTTLMAVAPFALGFPLKMGPATIYNRLGYSLLALGILEATVPLKARTGSAEFWGGFSTGLVLSLSLFLKITYFAAAVFLLLALLPCQTQTKRRWGGIGAGFVVVSLLCCAYFGFDLIPMLRDLRMIAGGKQIHLEAYLLDDILQQGAVALAVALLAALLLKDRAPRRALSLAVMGLSIWIAGTALILGNSEQSGFPLGALLAILSLNELISAGPTPSQETNFSQFPVFLLGAILIGSALFSGLLGSGIGVAGRAYLSRKLPPLHSPVLSGFIMAGDDFAYGEFVNDGLALVDRYRRPGDTIMSLDFTNPFSYGLGMKPASGGTTVLQYQTTFNDSSRPAAQSLFGAAKLVAVPKNFSDGSLNESIGRLYGAYLNSHFKEVGESKDWLLYRTLR